MHQVVHVIVDDRLQSRRANEEQWYWEEVKRAIKMCFFFFRFSERAQTDFGVNAVINWAKEGNLGPEVGGVSHLFYQANPAWL